MTIKNMEDKIVEALKIKPSEKEIKNARKQGRKNKILRYLPKGSFVGTMIQKNIDKGKRNPSDFEFLEVMKKETTTEEPKYTFDSSKLD